MELAAFLFFTLVFAGLAFISCAMAMEAKLADPAIPQPQAVHAILQNAPEETLIIETTATPETATEAPEPELLYDVPLDDSLQRYIREECEAQGVPFEIALALIQKESSCRESVISKTGDYGLMQVNECNHEWLSEELGITDILDPEQTSGPGFTYSDRLSRNTTTPIRSLWPTTWETPVCGKFGNRATTAALTVAQCWKSQKNCRGRRWTK